MGKLALATRSLSTLVRAIQFLICVMVLAIFSYYLAWEHRRHRDIPRWQKAVEGMSGAGVIYTAFGVVLTCFLGGIMALAFVAIVLDVCFVGVFIAIAILTRRGAHSCGYLNESPIGPFEHTSCQMERAVFAVSIAAVFLFLISAALQVALARHHTTEKKYGPSPANNYTSGSGKRKFWARKNRKNRQAELNTMEAAGATNGVTHANGTTDVGAAENGYGGANNKYTAAQPTAPTNGVSYAPQGTGYQATGYVPQESGVVGGGPGTSAPAEMPANTTHGAGGYVR